MDDNWLDDLVGPLDLLEVPESIFELYEAEDEIASTNPSTLHSLYCSTNCSRWPSISSTLDDIDAIINEDNLLTVMPAPPKNTSEKCSIMDYFQGTNEGVSGVSGVSDVSGVSKDASVQTNFSEEIPECEGFGQLTLEDIGTSKSRRRQSSTCSRTSSITKSSSGSVLEKRKKKSSVLHFLLCLMNDSSYKSLIEWVDKEEGTFKVNKEHAEEVVHIWNRKKKKSVKNWNNFA